MPSAATPTQKSRPKPAAAAEDAPSQPLGPILSFRQFWDLMERWHIPDATALELIEFSGKIGVSGKRPRFRFNTRQKRITSYLPEIDAALVAAGEDQVWLHRKIRGGPMSGHAPIEHMVAHGMEGMADVLQLLNRAAMRSALTKAAGRPGRTTRVHMSDHGNPLAGRLLSCPPGHNARTIHKL